MLNSLFVILPRALYAIMNKLPKDILMTLEEIRVRENRPLEVIFQGKYGFVSVNGTVSMNNRLSTAYIPTHEDCMQFLDLLSNHSLYTMEEELKRGYVTVLGGHRIGLAGTTVIEQGEVKQLQAISSFNIRLAREVTDAGKPLLPHLMDHTAKTVHHTLIISPPQQGKTTIARDLARLISYGMWPDSGVHWGGLKVGIVDERSELAACHKGVPSFDVGPRTDVLDSCPKAEGMMMMIRSLSPEVIVVDEIGREADAAAIHEAIHAGIRIIATAHGQSMEDIKGRPLLKKLMSENVFSRYVLLGRSSGKGLAECIYDKSGNRLNSIRLQGLRN
jgi:stage III sporulation protein AA